MMSLRKLGCGRAALRGGSSSGSSRALLHRDLFSIAAAAKPPGARGAGCGCRVPWKEAPFSALAMGQQVQHGAAREATMFGKGTAWETVRHAMTKQRRVPILNTRTNLSNQCGHMSFVILALAYLETDVLALRGYAASGIGLSILFQFYRPQPLWIPIGWNGLFLLINTSMIGLLLRERSEAANIGDDPEQAKTFEEVFKRVELSPVDFVRLMDVAERRVVPKGTCLSEEGRVQEEVFLIVQGAAQVEAEGDAVGHLEQKQFVGSMAFNRFIQASPSPSPSTSPSPASTAPPSEVSPAAAAAATTRAVSVSAGADALAARGGSTFPSPSHTTSIASDNNGVENGSGEIRFSAVIPSPPGDLENDADQDHDQDQDEDRVRKEAMGDEVEYGDCDDNDDNDDVYHVVEHDSYIPGGGGVFEEAKEAALNVLRRDSIVGNIPMAQSFVLDAEGHRRHGVGGMERSGTTVTATTEMVVYAWDMHLLRAFIKRRSLAGAAFMKAISADLIRKVDQSRGAEERYRLLLAEALDGGVITPIEKKKLHRYRSLHGISPKEHKELLREYSWREEEFEAGFQKGVAPRDGSKHFLAYEALVRRELAKGEVHDKGRQNLRKFRAEAGIDAQEHLLALEKQGWTADDYELGGKGKAAGLAENSGKLSGINVVDDDSSSGISTTTAKVETTAAEGEVKLPAEVRVEAEANIRAHEPEEAAKVLLQAKPKPKTTGKEGVEHTAAASAREPAADSPAPGAQQIPRKASASTSTSTSTGTKTKLNAHSHA